MQKQEKQTESWTNSFSFDSFFFTINPTKWSKNQTVSLKYFCVFRIKHYMYYIIINTENILTTTRNIIKKLIKNPVRQHRRTRLSLFQNKEKKSF